MLMDEKSQDSFQYNPDHEDDFASTEQNTETEQQKPDNGNIISWTGSEFIANHKGSSWFLTFFALLIIGVGAIFIITKDYISTVSVAIGGVLFALLANHKPRQLSYKIDNSGINIGSKFYGFEQFKSFSVAQDGAISYINLMPLKRFMPDISIYFPPEEEKNIVSLLSDHLPHNEAGERQIDKLAKKFRF